MTAKPRVKREPVKKEEGVEVVEPPKEPVKEPEKKPEPELNDDWMDNLDGGEDFEYGLRVSVKGPIAGKAGDYMHPEDLARYEVFRLKRDNQALRKQIVEYQKQAVQMKLKWQEQALRISKLEHDLKMKEFEWRANERETALEIAKADFQFIAQEVQEKYKLDADHLIYDDESGKLMDVGD